MTVSMKDKITENGEVCRDEEDDGGALLSKPVAPLGLCPFWRPSGSEESTLHMDYRRSWPLAKLATAPTLTCT